MRFRPKILLLALAAFTVGTSEYGLAGTLDLVSKGLNVSIGAAGALISVFALSYAIGTPIIMLLCGTTDRKKLILSSLSIFVASAILAFFLDNFAALLAVRIIMAFAVGTTVVSALQLSVKLSGPNEKASALGTVIAGFTMALVVGVPLGRLISTAFGWHSIFLVVGVVGVIALSLIAKFLPSIEGDAPVPLRRQLSLLRNPVVVRGLFVSFFWIGGYATLYFYLTTYLLHVMNFPEVAISPLLFAFGIASLFGSKLGGALTDKLGVPRVLSGSLIVHAFALAAFGGLAVQGAPVSAVVVMLVLWSLAAWVTGPTQQYNLATLVPEASGVLLGLNQSVMQAAQAAGSAFGGLIISLGAFKSLPLIASLVVLTGVVLYLSELLVKRREVQGA